MNQEGQRLSHEKARSSGSAERPSNGAKQAEEKPEEREKRIKREAESSEEREWAAYENEEEEIPGEFFEFGGDLPMKLEDREEDDYEDPYKDLTVEELKERLPAYMFFKTSEEKEIYFDELNNSYFTEISGIPDKQPQPNREVVFNTNKNLVQRKFSLN